MAAMKKAMKKAAAHHDAPAAHPAMKKAMKAKAGKGNEKVKACSLTLVAHTIKE